MPSFMPIGLKLWALEGYTQTDRQTNHPILIIQTSLQADYADLPARPAGLLGRFAPSGFTLRARILLALLARFALTKIFEKKVYLNRLEMI